MNAFFWTPRKPSKELVLKVDALLQQLFPDELVQMPLAPKSSESRDSGDAAAVAPVVVPSEEHNGRLRADSADAEDDEADDDEEETNGTQTDTTTSRRDADANGTTIAPDEEISEQSGDEEVGEDRSIPDELERLWAKIRSVFQAWEENVVDRERKMNCMAELLLRYRVLDKMLLPKVLTAMTFETRKYVAHVFRAFTVHGFHGFIAYLADRPELLRRLIEGYKHNSTALICGSMLRDCLEHEVIPVMFFTDLQSGLDVLVKTTKTNTNFDIAADAFRNISKILMGHKTATLPYLMASHDRIFGLLNGLLDSTNYVTKRQALQLLGELLLDPVNFTVMQTYVASRNNLRAVMLLLREPSLALRKEAYNVFKIFVANPNKSPEVEQLLVRNQDKLLAFVTEFGKNDSSRDFQNEKSLVMYSLKRLVDRSKSPPPVPQVKTTETTSGSVTSPASPTPAH